MNIVIFFLQVLAVVLGVRWAHRLGKEALIALSALLAILANLFVLKQMFVLGWNITCSDPFAIGTLYCLNVVQREWGLESAKRSILISFFAMLFFGLMSQLHLFYVPSLYDTTDAHYRAILGQTPRLFIASITTFFVVQQIDLRLFRWLKYKMTVSLLISQAIDTVLFSLLGLWGVVEEISTIIVASYLVKCGVVVMTTLSNRWVRREV